jgi:hypothetical protein
MVAASFEEGRLGSRSLAVFTRALALVPVLALSLATSSCGSDSPAGTASCTLSQMLGTISQKICEEGMNLSSAQVQQLMQQCMVSGGFGPDAGISQQAGFAYGPCSHDGALGGCRVVQGGMTVVAWYYEMPGFTSADIQQLCSGVGASFVPP